MKRTLGWLFAVLMIFAFILAFYGIRSTYVHDYTETVTVGKIGDEEGYKIQVCSICGKTERVALGDGDKAEDNTVSFGSYPQDKVIGTLAEDLAKAYTLPTDAASKGWTNAGNYYYRDVTYEGKQYRGLYLSAANSYFKGGENSNQAANGYEVGKAYWFAFSPIVWNAATVDGKTVLTATKILDAVYASKDSDSVSRFLNGKFRKAGFAAFSDGLIDGGIDAASSPASMQTSDYAAALGLYVFADAVADGCSYWWSTDCALIDGAGNANEMTDTYLGGVVPSLVFKP